jgi:membrane-associated protease RseP (regulator of RpoE activity)
LAAVAAINYTIFHSLTIFIVLFTIFVHELGHYFTAKINNVEVQTPIFLPIPFLLVGLTKIFETNNKKIDKKIKQKILFYGPFTSVLFLLLLLVAAIILKFNTSIILMLLFGEIVFNYFGSDGKKYRTAS